MKPITITENFLFSQRYIVLIIRESSTGILNFRRNNTSPYIGELLLNYLKSSLSNPDNHQMPIWGFIQKLQDDIPSILTYPLLAHLKILTIPNVTCTDIFTQVSSLTELQVILSK